MNDVTTIGRMHQGASWLTAGAMLFALGQFLVGLEQYSARSVFAHNGLLAWSVLRFQSRAFGRGALGVFLDKCFGTRGTHALLLLRPLLSLLLAFALLVAPAQLQWMWLALLVVLIALYVRSPWGTDGAFQLSLLIVAAQAWAALSPTAESSAHLFLTFQLFFAYFVAGVAKLISPTWRSGQAVVGIFSTNMYGSEAARACVRSPGISALVCRTVIAFELAAAIVPFGPRPLLVLYLVVGALFHLVNMVTMGLGAFFFTFLSIYPSVYVLLGS